MSSPKNVLVLLLLFAIFMAELSSDEIEIVMAPFPGYVMHKDGKTTGPVIDLVIAMMKNTEHTYNVKVFPWARAYNKIIDGEANVLMPHLIKNEKREKLVKWVATIMPMEFWIIKKKARKDISFDSIEKAKKFKFISVNEDATTQYLQKNKFEHIDIIPKSAQPILMLEADRGDLIIQDKRSFLVLIEQLKLNKDDFEFVYQVEEMSKYPWIVFSSKTDDKIVVEMQVAYEKLITDGTYKKILNKWGLEVKEKTAKPKEEKKPEVENKSSEKK